MRFGAQFACHDASHHAKGEKKEKLRKRDEFQLCGDSRLESAEAVKESLEHGCGARDARVGYRQAQQQALNKK